MILDGTSRHLTLRAGVAALLLFLSGCAATGAAPGAGPSATSAPAEKWTFGDPESDDSGDEDVAPEIALALEPSTPVSLSVPSIDLETELIATGLRADRTLEVPPRDPGSPASWYDGSPTPGSIGSAVVLGHVNSPIDSNGVFKRIAELTPGTQVMVAREDGTVATFEVYRNEAYEKSEFPTKTVYAPARGAEIRLITCENYIEEAQSHDQNRVVYARLIATT